MRVLWLYFVHLPTNCLQVPGMAFGNYDGFRWAWMQGEIIFRKQIQGVFFWEDLMLRKERNLFLAHLTSTSFNICFVYIIFLSCNDILYNISVLSWLIRHRCSNETYTWNPRCVVARWCGGPAHPWCHRSQLVSSPCVAGPNWFQGIRWRGDHGEICEMHPFPAFFITYTDERNKIQKIYYPLILLEEANQISLWYN